MPRDIRVSLYTLGCKLNQAETEELKNSLIKKGFLIAPFAKGEDIAVIRACGVTCKASQTTREIIRKAKRIGAYIITIGCLENKNLEEINFVAKNNKEIIRHITKYFPRPLNKEKICKEQKRTRAFIKIQTGCNFSCAYCIIPKFRGKSQSAPAYEIIKKINHIVKDGYKEVVLTGVNICLYKHKTYDLAGLLTEILKKTKIERIRLGSLDPRLISNKLIQLFTQCSNKTMPAQGGSDLGGKQCNNVRLMPHWHLSLQSGSNTVLKRMARGYTNKQYLTIVNKLRQCNPLFSFTTDIIVGFPGETNKEFKETCEFVKKIGFTKIHIFPFSPRANTHAAKLKPVTQRIATERVKILTAIANETAKKYSRQFANLTRPVLFENKKDAYYYGYTPEYIRVKLKSNKKLENKIIIIKLKKLICQ